MTKDEIQAEWDAFIEYPEGSERLYVTTTSALIFARAIAGMVSKRHAQAAQPDIEALRKELEEVKANRALIIEALAQLIKDTL